MHKSEIYLKPGKKDLEVHPLSNANFPRASYSGLLYQLVDFVVKIYN